jgi:Flp pilus assembly protein TadD
MRSRVTAGALAGAILALTATDAPFAAAATAGLRGRVIDEAGAPIGDVKLEMEFLGESRVKVARSVTTDKKGGFVRMGIPDGKWKITFSKEGYRTYIMEIVLSLGGFSEAGDVVLKAAPVAAAAPSAEPAAAVLPPSPEANKAGEDYTKALEAARAGRVDEAEPLLKEVVARFPDLANAHYNLAYVHQVKKDWKAAEAAYLRVTELEPAKSDAYLALAAVRQLDNRTGEAADGLLAAAPNFAEDPKFQFMLGATCANAGRNAEAEAAFRKAMALDPQNPEPLFQLGTILVGQNKVPEAVSLLERYVGMTGQAAANLQTANGLLAALKKK